MKKLAILFGIGLLSVLILSSSSIAQRKGQPGEFSSVTKDAQRTKVSAEQHYLGYDALSEVAARIVNVVRSRNPNSKSLIICGKDTCSEFSKLRLLNEIFMASSGEIVRDFEDKEIESNIETLIEKLRKKKNRTEAVEFTDRQPRVAMARSVEPIDAVLKDVTGLVTQTSTSVGAVAGLVQALTKTSISVESAVVDANNSHLTTAIAGRARHSGAAPIRVYLPEYEQIQNVDVVSNPVFKRFQELRRIIRISQELATIFDSTEPVGLEDDELRSVATLKRLFEKTTVLFKEASTLRPVRRGEKQNCSNDVIANICTLESLLIAGRVSEALKNGGMVLSVDVIKVLGTRVEKRNLILGVRNRFSGSATVQFVLTDENGRLVDADTIIVHTGSKKHSQVKRKEPLP